ncbi:S-adenosyl-L-methionine-dependent methyltransferases superfamily protein [Citrus sinensis]|uniref:S-adenosyl-L-methionine-dependent methyltransferases superfamily protein n=1 Tax=Citrus sinensis TaxID=2711 RepID=A0ACB8NBW8_CITSI|nr:S-adenosyl-L-methionine-dependent methyltransferases superfamily protein [Citrus sinensis]
MASLAVTEFVINPASASRLISNPITNNTFFFFCFCFPKRGASLLLKSHLHSASRFRKANATTSSSSSDQYDQRQQQEEENFQDEFVSLPAIVPNGPIAIYGLGGGTAAHLMLDLWPSLKLEGWEIDEILIDKVRDYFGLSDLEKPTATGGVLQVHIGDVFSPSEDASGRYAGIVVDLFSEGKVLPQLEEVATWLKLKDRLMPNGRFMVNCGGIDGVSDMTYGAARPKSMNDVWMHNSAIRALSEAFPGKVSWKRMPERNGENFLALTGLLPDLSSWSAAVPGHLSETVKKWKPCAPSQ